MDGLQEFLRICRVGDNVKAGFQQPNDLIENRQIVVGNDYPETRGSGANPFSLVPKIREEAQVRRCSRARSETISHQ
jgi:hypothetical protein